MSFSSGTMGVGVMAIFSGLIGAYGLRAVLLNNDPDTPAAATTVVPLATTELPTGRRIRLGDISLNRLTVQQQVERKLRDTIKSSASKANAKKKAQSPVHRRLMPYGVPAALATWAVLAVKVMVMAEKI